MKKNDCLAVLLGLLIGASANAVSHYTTATDTVVDNFTGLEWQRKAAEPRSQASAQKYCRDLVLNGKDDWKLPTVEELSTLPDRHRRNPAIDVDAFPNTPTESFWTSSAVVGEPNGAWDVDFYYGYVNYSDVNNNNRVRCLR